jgi:AraC family transcriptional regulator, positive regulator of tynA and feaB
MYQQQVLSTDGIPASKRVEYWNEVIGGTLVAQVADPADPRHFSGSLKSLAVGDIRIAEIRADASRVTRNARHVAHASEAVWLMRFQLAGSVTAFYDGQEIRLEPGDFMLYDSTRPYGMLFNERAAILALRVPQNILLRYMGAPDRFSCRVMSGSSGASALASQFFRGFWQRCGELHTEEVVKQLLDTSMRLVASAYADLPQSQVDSSCPQAGHRLRIIQFIERNLRDPELSPTRIAGALRMTPGYLHRILCHEPESASRYIMRRRLEECARALADPAQRARSVTDLAFDFGFNSLAHFSRAFREHHGMTAREYRQRTAGI